MFVVMFPKLFDHLFIGTWIRGYENQIHGYFLLCMWMAVMDWIHGNSENPV